MGIRAFIRESTRPTVAQAEAQIKAAKAKLVNVIAFEQDEVSRKSEAVAVLLNQITGHRYTLAQACSLNADVDFVLFVNEQTE